MFAIFCKSYGIDITNNGGEKFAHSMIHIDLIWSLLWAYNFPMELFICDKKKP